MIIVGDKNGGIYGHKKPKAVIGANSWGGAVAAKVFRGSSVDDQTLRKTIDTAKEKELPIFDLAQVYGLGKAQKKMGVNLWSGIWQNLGGAMWIFTGCTVRLTQKITLLCKKCS